KGVQAGKYVVAIQDHEVEGYESTIPSVSVSRRNKNASANIVFEEVPEENDYTLYIRYIDKDGNYQRMISRNYGNIDDETMLATAHSMAKAFVLDYGEYTVVQEGN